MVTCRSPVCELQLTAKVVVIVSCAGTLTVRGFEPDTVQLEATLSSWTVWSPTDRPATATVSLIPRCVPAPPSTTRW